MARLLFLASFLLMVAAPVGAEPFAVPETWVPSCWEVPPGGTYYHPCAADVLIEKGWIEKRHLAWFDAAQKVGKLDPCLAQMEAAMQAWDRYITELDKGPQVPAIPGEQWRYDQWDAAKTACWKEAK